MIFLKIDVTKYRKILNKHNISAEKKDISYVLYNIERNTIEHIVHRYPNKLYAAALIKYFEEEENYRKCAELKGFIETNNRLNGENTKTKL